MSGSGRSCGVEAGRTSRTAANAETISDTGAMTSRSTSPSRHVVRIDNESLPTGMPTPSAGQSAMPTACTASYNAASCPRVPPVPSPQAAIQLADSLTSPIFSTGAASRFVNASPTAMRAEAAASIVASGVRSPIAIASPAKPA